MSTGFFVYLCKTHLLIISYYSDYGGNELLDTSSNSSLDDEDLFEPISAAAQCAAEAKMQRCDCMARGSWRGMRAATRTPGAMCPPFSTVMTWALRMITNLNYCVYVSAVWWAEGYGRYGSIGDVRFPLRPLCCAGLLYLEREVPLEQLSDIKAKSIVEWIASNRVRWSIVKHFCQFLMTCIDHHGALVYGQCICNLGQSESFLFILQRFS
jgi:DNA replication licensing factor MCM2